MKLKATLFAAAATFALAPAAHAYEGLYGAIGAGLSYMGDDLDVESDGTATFPAFDTEADFDNGIGVYTTLGKAWGNSWRTELEFSHRNNDVRHWPGDGLGFSGLPTQLTGDLTSNALLLNVIRDFDTGGRLTPFVGAGVGGVRHRLEAVGSNPGNAGQPFAVNIGDIESTLAFQGIAGLGIGLADNLSLDLTYRYFRSLKPSFLGTLNGSVTRFDHAYKNHGLFAGLRWNFGAAVPPAPQYKDCWDGSSVPVSAECPPQLVEETGEVADDINIIVYFDYDKANLTPEASNLVREASARALENDIDTVVVSGNTDTSGSSAYNQALSQRRAAVVREALIANGVPADRIETRAMGESNLAKPTPDGTREPLNRRSEVTISFE